MSPNKKKWLISAIVSFVIVTIPVIAMDAFLEFDIIHIILFWFVFLMLSLRGIIGLASYITCKFFEDITKENKREEVLRQANMANEIGKVVSELRQQPIANEIYVAEQQLKYESYSCENCGATGYKAKGKQQFCEYCGSLIT